MCIIYFKNIQCGLVNVCHYLLTGRKKRQQIQTPSERIELSPFAICIPVLGGSFDKASGQPAYSI